MINYKTTKTISADQLNTLWNAIGWKSRPTKRWEKALSSSSLVVSAWDGERLVGLGRVLEDGVMSMLYDIAVLPEHQLKGIGSVLMKQLINFLKDKDYVSIGLFAWEGNPANIPFYEKFGFKKTEGGMELNKYMTTE